MDIIFFMCRLDASSYRPLHYDDTPPSDGRLIKLVFAQTSPLFPTVVREECANRSWNYSSLVARFVSCRH